MFRRRTRVIAGLLAEWLPSGATVLDVGCGDGRIDARVARLRPDVEIEGLDVRVRPGAGIPVQPFDGLHVPRPSASVEAVLLIDVLHHARDPVALLRESIRVARRAIFVKDHIRQGWLAEPTLRLMDWVGNAPHGVQLRYDYWDISRWREAFRELGLEAVRWRERLGLYPPPWRWIFERRLHFLAQLRLRPELDRPDPRSPDR